MRQMSTCIYSLRPKPFAPASMPLHWEEVKKGLKIKDHNLKTAIARLKETEELLKGPIGIGINVSKAISKMRSAFEII